MSVRGFTPFGVTGPRGPWTRLDERPTPRTRGSRGYNVRFEPNRVKTRDGFSAALAVSDKVTGLYHWVTNYSGFEINRLIYFENGVVKMRDLVSGTTNTLFTQAGRSFSPAEAASRLYIPIANTAGIGASKVRIVNALIGGVPADFAFAPPLTVVPSMSETGAGQVTEGLHRFGYILETRTGFTGKPSPVSAGIFAPVSFTVGSGGKTLSMAWSGTTPDDAAALHPIMTRTDNLERWYFVPDASISIPGGASWSTTMTINISDEDLARSAEEVDEHFDYLTQDGSGNGPFNPHKCVEFGQRMVYLTPQKAYISDPRDYQVVTEIEHVIQNPGERLIVTGFPIRGNFYFLGPAWTYGVSDNNDRPRLWGQPELISGALGTTGVNCVEWRTGGDYAWVANYSGLYFFDGQYDIRPVSYMVEPEWRRINWAAAYAIEVKDDYVKQRVIVSAPLDGATEPTHMLVFDYSQGKKWTDIDFSLDTLPTNFSSIGLVQDRTTGRTDLWVGPSAAGNIVKQTLDLRNDNGSAIDSQYETSLLIPESAGWKYMKMGWLEFDVSGSGSLDMTVFGLDRAYSEVLTAITLAAAPGEHPLLGMDFNDENFTVRVRTNAVGAWFDLSRITGYCVKWMTN